MAYAGIRLVPEVSMADAWAVVGDTSLNVEQLMSEVSNCERTTYAHDMASAVASEVKLGGARSGGDTALAVTSSAK